MDEKEYGQEEALKLGIWLTIPVRQVRIDLEEEIKGIDKEIDKLAQKKAYSKLVFWCLNEYVWTGNLKKEWKKEKFKKIKIIKGCCRSYNDDKV